jgi:hypothetical protein
VNSRRTIRVGVYSGDPEMLCGPASDFRGTLSGWALAHLVVTVPQGLSPEQARDEVTRVVHWVCGSKGCWWMEDDGADPEDWCCGLTSATLRPSEPESDRTY